MSGSYYYGTNPRHRGTDFWVPSGNPVYAAASGTVEYIHTGCVPGTLPVNISCGDGLGNWVGIVHADGMRSMYGHLTSVNVTVGQVITCTSGPGGTVIGYSGNTGDSTNQHLHFELRYGGLNIANTSYDPFGGSLSQSFDYWYQYALVADPLHPGYQMHYPATTCAP
ncbi:MAG: M23 family metallopeptidase [Candidatus Paceibacteria bacterium]